MEAIQATSKGKAAVRLVTQKKAGAVRKPARCTKVIKKAFKHSKAELGSAGKADSKKVAAMLKMAKRAELAPSAAAKMPQLQPIFSSAKSSLRLQHAVESPAQARGRPNSSSKARVPATDVAMQGLEHSCYGSNQSDFSQTQQHDMVDTVGQPFGSVGSTDAQLLGKRKRSTPTTAMPEEGMVQKKALEAVHHQVATIDWLYMSGDRPTEKAKQAATYQLNHIKPVQQAAAQQTNTAGYTQQEQPTDHVVVLQQIEPMQQAQTQGPEHTDSASFQLQSNPLRSNKRQRVHQATAQPALTGKVAQTPSCARHLCASTAVQTMMLCMSTAGECCHEVSVQCSSVCRACLIA